MPARFGKWLLVAASLFGFCAHATALELKLTDGTIITCERVAIPAGIISAAPGLEIWMDARTRTGQPLHSISTETLEALSEQADLARILKPYLQTRLATVNQPDKTPLHRPVMAAMQEELIQLVITGDGTTDLSLRATRTEKFPNRPLVIQLNHPLFVRSQNAADSVLFLSVFGNPRNITLPAVSAAQKSARPVFIGGLSAVELDKPIIQSGTAFQVVEADLLTAWLDSAGKNLSTGGAAAISQHHNAEATWEKVATAQTTPQARYRGIANLRPEDWAKGKAVLAYAKERAGLVQKSLGGSPAVLTGQWVPVTIDEFTAAITDLQSEVDAFLTFSSFSTGETPASLTARQQNAQRNIAGLRARGEQVLKSLPVSSLNLQIFSDGHYWFARPGYQMPEKIEGDPFGDRRVATLGRCFWDGYRFQNQSGTTEGRIGAGSVSSTGIIMLQISGGYFYGWKKAGAELPVATPPVTTAAAGATPAPASPSTPQPQMRRELLLDQAYRDGLITARLRNPAGPLEITRTEKAGLGPLVIKLRRGIALTFADLAKPAMFIKPGEGITIPPSAPVLLDNTRLVGIDKLAANAQVTGISEADRFVQYILASDKVSHEIVLPKLAIGGTTPLLQRLRTEFDAIDKLTGGNPEQWITGNWTSAPQTAAGEAHIALADQKIETEIQNNPNMEAGQANQARALFQKMARDGWSIKYGVNLPRATATFSPDGTLVIKSNRGFPAGLQWWWDGRHVRIDKYTQPDQAIGLASNGILSNGELFLHLQKAAGQ